MGGRILARQSSQYVPPFTPPFTSASSQLGNKFGAHFGPANNGTVEVVEFGNEPWNGYGPGDATGGKSEPADPDSEDEKKKKKKQ